MARAGAVWLDVLPSMKSWNSAVQTQAKASLTGVGEASGKSFTAGMTGALKTGGAEMTAQMKAMSEEAAITTQQASSKVVAARKREADAAGQVRVAEAKLEEVRTKEGATASQIARAEEMLAKAQRNHQATTRGVTTATTEYSTALLREEEVAGKAAATSEVAAVRFAKAGVMMRSATGRMKEGVAGIGSTVKSMAGFTAVFAAADFAGHSVKEAIAFEKSTNILVTAAEESRKNLSMIRAGIIKISDTTGASVDQLSEGMYTVEKAGIRGANGLKVLRAAAIGAVEEGANLSTVTNAMTSIMTSYNIKASQSSMVMNALATAAGASKTTLEEFAASLATVLPLASANKISFADVGGAIGTITSHGTTAYQATEELAFAIRNLAAPNAVAIKEMGQLGIASQNVQQHLGKRGILGTIQMLSEAILKQMGPSGKVLLNTLYKSTSAGSAQQQMFGTMSKSAQQLAKGYADGTVSVGEFRQAIKDASGTDGAQLKQWQTLYNTAHGFNTAIKQGLPGTQTFTEAMKKMMGGANGLNVALMLLGGNAPLTKKRIDEITHSFHDAAQQAARQHSALNTTNAIVQQSAKTIGNLGMQIAAVLLPPLAQLLKGFVAILVPISTFVSTNWSWIKPTATAILSIVVALKAWSLIQHALNAEMWAFPITWIVAGLAALVVGFVIAYKHVGWFRDAVNGVMNFFKTNWKLIATLAAGPLGILVRSLIEAYQHSETFRNIVNAAFHAIGVAAKFMARIIGTTVLGILTSWTIFAQGIVKAAKFAFGWIPWLKGDLNSLDSQLGAFRTNMLNIIAELNGKKITITTNYVNHGRPPALPGSALVPGAVVQPTNPKPPKRPRPATPSFTTPGPMGRVATTPASNGTVAVGGGDVTGVLELRTESGYGLDAYIDARIDDRLAAVGGH